MANEVDYIPCKYRGNGLTSHFSFRWKIFTEKDIIVQLEDVVSGKQVIQQYATDYSVTFNDVGGFVSFVNPPTEDSYIVISRNVSDYQSKTYSTSTGFQGSELEDSFDEVSCNIQELEYDLKRAIKVPVGSSVLNLDLPLPQAGKTLKWNKEENGLVNSTINVDTLENIANRLYESVDNVDLVAENTENIKAVNENEANINIVASAIENVNTVGNNIANVNAVAENQTNINAVNDNATNINTVANSIGNVNSVGTNIEAVKSVNANEANINAVNENKANINTVASAIENVNTVGNDIANVNAVAENQTNINTVAANGADITTVAGSIKNVNNVGSNIKAVQQVSVIAENVNTVATDILNVHEVGTHINDVVTVKNGLGSVEVVANNIADVQAVEAIQESITTVAQNKDTVVSVGNNIATITAVNANKNNINAVAGNEATINAVNANKNNINTVSGLSAKISAVVDNETNIDTVAANTSSIVSVANSITNVNAVGGNIANVSLVAGNATNINTVATNISDVSAVADATAYIEVCADNIEDIKSAPSFAEQAKDSAKQSIYRDLFQCNSLNLNAEKPKTYFEYIENLKHSTFDKSKFTVVGTPTITDNGVASGFSATNYIKIPGFPTIKDNITIFCKFNSGYKETSITNFLFGWYNSENLSYFRFDFMSNSVFRASWRDKNLVTGGSPTNIAMQTNSDHTLKVILTNAHIECYLDGNLWFSKDAELDFSHLKPEYFTLGAQNVVSTWFLENGSIDLSQFSVKVDGVEVFSGNKTDIDTIKADDYTVVGTPTTSADGVVSGFSSANYIKTPSLTISSDKNFEIVGRFRTPTVWNTESFDSLFSNTTLWTNGLIFINNTAQKIRAYFNNQYVEGAPLELSTNYEYIYKHEASTGNRTLRVINLDTGVELPEGTVTNTATFSMTSTWNIGIRSNKEYPFNGSIDLNAFKIYVDGNLVYQPCLKIPYTQSKTGSKIVDAFYRDRVQDVYSQGFDKYYYTLDEANKSIDELTGFNQTLSVSKTDDSTVTKFADGAVEICGRVTTAGTINLPVTLKDTNYFCTLPTTEKTTTSFTTTQTGDYILKGELA